MKETGKLCIGETPSGFGSHLIVMADKGSDG